MVLFTIIVYFFLKFYRICDDKIHMDTKIDSNLKIYWHTLCNSDIQQNILKCQTILDSDKYSDATLQLVVDTQRFLIGILEERCSIM